MRGKVKPYDEYAVKVLDFLLSDVCLQFTILLTAFWTYRKGGRLELDKLQSLKYNRPLKHIAILVPMIGKIRDTFEGWDRYCKLKCRVLTTNLPTPFLVVHDRHMRDSDQNDGPLYRLGRWVGIVRDNTVTCPYYSLPNAPPPQWEQRADSKTSGNQCELLFPCNVPLCSEAVWNYELLTPLTVSNPV